MVPFLTRIVGGFRRFVRVGGRMARATPACKAKCCNVQRRYVKVVHCCDAEQYFYVSITDVNQQGDPIWELGQGSRLFRYVNECYVSEPQTVLTEAELQQLGQAHTIQGQPSGGWDAAPGTCDNPTCPGCRCCSMATIEKCGVNGPGNNVCCSCGSRFILTFRGVVRYYRTVRFQGGIVGLGIDPCTGAGDPPPFVNFCYAPISGEGLAHEYRYGLTFRILYECDQYGTWTTTCLEYGFDYRGHLASFEGWNTVDPYWGDNECPPGDGYPPKQTGFIPFAFDDQGCESNSGGAFPFLNANAACGLGSSSAWWLMGNIGSEAFNELEFGWADQYNSVCNGSLEHAYDPFPRGCGGTIPGGTIRFVWSRDVKCGRGRMRDSVNMVKPASGTLVMSREAEWDVQTLENCAPVNNPCPPEPPQPVTFTDSTTFGGQPPRTSANPQRRAFPLSTQRPAMEILRSLLT